MPNVNTLIVVKVLESIHASTVERRLPQLRGWRGLSRRPTPSERQRAPIPQPLPHHPTLFPTWARLVNTALN